MYKSFQGYYLERLYIDIRHWCFKVQGQWILVKKAACKTDSTYTAEMLLDQFVHALLLELKNQKVALTWTTIFTMSSNRKINMIQLHV